MGCRANRHLHDLAESIIMNVGGPCGEGCSPPMKRTGVGAAIVLGARESRVHGEGRQGIDVRLTNSWRPSGEARVGGGCALQAQNVQSSEMATLTKPSQQSGTESCVGYGNVPGEA